MTALEKAWFDGYEDDINNALQDLRQEIVSLATAKQEQGEPVAYVHADELEELSHCNGMSVWAENALAHTDDSLSKQLLPSGYVALYPAPQQRKPLTDDEKLGLATSWFAEDWAIKNAIGLLNDHETFQGIKEQP